MSRTSDYEVHSAALEVVQSTLIENGLIVRSVAPLPASYHGSTFVAATPAGRAVVKLRPAFRNVAASRSACALLKSRGVVSQDVLVGPVSTDLGWLIALSWLPGDHLAPEVVSSLAEKDVHEIGRELGQSVKRLHQRCRSATSWFVRADRRFKQKLDSATSSGHLSADLTQDLSAIWTSISSELIEAPVVLTHRDLMPGNILVKRGRLAGLIDFEHARLADPLYDLVKLQRSTLPLHPLLDGGFQLGYGLEEDASSVSARFIAVQLLEALSAISYFNKRADIDAIGQQVGTIESILGSGLNAPSIGGS